MVSLDGTTSYIGHEFIKLLNTGSSHLATEAFVNTAVANGGGGGGTGTTNLTTYYNKSETDTLLNNKYDKTETDTLLNNKYDKSETDTLLNNKYDKSETDTLLNNKYNKSETDTLLDAKLNINNPQDMSGTLRLGHIDGLSKIILNGVASSKDFFVNGDSEINGNHLVASLDSSGYIKGSHIQSNTFNALNTNDIVFQSNSDTYIEYDVSETKIVASKVIQCGGNLTTQEIDTIAPLDLILKRNAISMIELQDNLTVLKTETQCENNIVCDNYESKNLPTIMNYVMNESTGEIKFYVGSPTNPDTTTNLVMTLQNNLITFHKPTSPEIGAGGGVDDSNLVKYTGEALQVIENDLVLCGGAQSGSFDLTVNGTTYFGQSIELNLGLSIGLGSNKGYIRSINLGGGNHAYDYANFSSGVYHRFYVGGSPFPQYLRFQLSSTQAYFNVDAVCNAELQTNTINTKDAGNSDLIFKRNDTNIFKLNTSNQIQLLGGNETSFIYEDAFVDLVNYNVLRIRNTENVENGIISFGVGDVLDVFQIFKTGITSSVELSIPQVLCNSYDSFAGDNDVVFNRNGVEFFRLQGSNVVVNGPENLLLVSDGNVGISSSWMFANTFANRTAESDTDFRGCIAGGLASGTVYMTYEHVPERLHIKTDAEVSEGKKFYLTTTGTKECFIHSFVESNVRILSLENSDTAGQNRIYCGGNLVIDMSGTVLNLRQNTTVVAGVSLSGELTDTSDKRKKYDIQDAEYDFTEIVKSIKPKTFKLYDEKDIGITKNHIGFIADEVLPVIPPEWENIIVTDNEGIKKLNYIKMGSITWGAVRELIEENQGMKSQIERLESRLFEVENFIKDFVKPKPKAKAKPKAKK